MQHLEALQRAKAEWVPVGRLRVPWEHREAYLEREARWGRAQSHEFSSAERDAAWDLLSLTLSPRIADIYGGGGGGLLEVEDLPALSRQTGLAEAALTGHPDAFTEDGRWYLPWPTAAEVVAALGRRNSRLVLEHVVSSDRKLRESVGTSIETWPSYLYASPAQQAQMRADLLDEWTQTLAEGRRALLEWADFESPGLAEEYLALRHHHDALVAAIYPVLEQLRSKRTKKATVLEATLRELIATGPSPLFS